MLQNWPGNAALGARAFGRSFPPWFISACLTVAVAIAYFLTARFSLSLLTKPDGVAVFWPAAGISAGVLIGVGSTIALPVIIGVMAATIAANLLGDRNILSAIVFAVCNAFEAVLVAGLIERYFGSPFRLDSLQRVLGLVAAAILGCAVSGVGGAIGYLLFHQSTASALTIWHHWFASDAIGIVTVAPFVIGLVALERDVPALRETVEAAVALTALTLASLLLIVMHRAPWDDVALVSIFPILLWTAARCSPVFVAAAALIITLVIVSMITFQIGLFGDRSIVIGDRILTAQAVILAFSLCALSLGALFAERRESELRLQGALRAGQVVAFDWDARSDVSRHSENAAQLLGINLSVPAASFIERVHPDDRPRIDACIRNLRPDNASYTISYGYLRPDGQRGWFESTGKAEFDKAGRISRIRGLRVDITERKRFEEELVEARKAAEQAEKAAEHANRAKSAFLAAASHDLRQPLQAIKILQETLAQQIHDSAARKSIVSIGHSMDTMTDMLNSLLDINQLEAGTLRPSTSDFSINNIFDELAAEFREPATEKGLRWRLVRSRIAVHSDRRFLKEMIRNLLSNAIRYTDRGSVLVGCRRAGDKVRIEVWDSGVGIMGEQMPHIFEEHYQGPQSAQLGGFGLGLAIAQRLGNLLKHEIGARSTPGRGSVFSITVPLGHGVSKARPTIVVPPEKFGTPLSATVLIIEDEGSVRAAMERWLRLQGLDVVSVTSGNEALALVTEKGMRFDLVLSDYNIPGRMNGLDSVHALRAALVRKIPAIMLTGDTRSEVIDTIAKHDVAVTVKPVKMVDLMALIKSQLTN